jgi:hypothetical protein
MNRGRRTANYARGTATNPYTIKNLYKYGGTVWVLIYFVVGFAQASSVAGATNILLNVYIMKLFGWPWDQLLLAETLWGLVRSHFQTWIVGWITATAKYGLNS